MVFTHGLVVRPFSTAFLASSAAPIITDGLEVLVHEVIAAIATAPWSSSNSVPSSSVTLAGFDDARAAAGRVVAPVVGAPSPLPPSECAGASLEGKDSSDCSSTLDLTAGALGALDVVGQRGAEGLLGVGQRDPVLGALGAGQRGDDLGEVELEPLGVARLGLGVVPEALLLGVGLDEGDLLRRRGR